jgi:hypothetical protein
MNDQPVIQRILKEIDNGPKIYVDIGCSYESNLPNEIISQGNKTLFFELDKQKTASWKCSENFKIINEKVTPINVFDLIYKEIPQNSDITYLDIDIDGYDFQVLESLLARVRPYLIVAEINEKIPPPIKFSVKYDENYFWNSSHFYGMSLSKFNELADKYEYDLIDLTANNIYAIRKDKNEKFKKFSVEEIYNEKYKNPRLNGSLPQFYYNSNFDHIMNMQSEDTIKFINQFFAEYKDKYELYI